MKHSDASPIVSIVLPPPFSCSIVLCVQYLPMGSCMMMAEERAKVKAYTVQKHGLFNLHKGNLRRMNVSPPQ